MADGIAKLRTNDTVGAVVTAGTLGAAWGALVSVGLAVAAVLLILVFAKR